MLEQSFLFLTLIKAAKGRRKAQTKKVGSYKHHFLSHPGLTGKELRTLYFCLYFPLLIKHSLCQLTPQVMFPGETTQMNLNCI